MELGAGSWELGAGSWELGAGSQGSGVRKTRLQTLGTRSHYRNYNKAVNSKTQSKLKNAPDSRPQALDIIDHAPRAKSRGSSVGNTRLQALGSRLQALGTRPHYRSYNKATNSKIQNNTRTAPDSRLPALGLIRYGHIMAGVLPATLRAAVGGAGFAPANQSRSNPLRGDTISDG